MSTEEPYLSVQTISKNYLFYTTKWKQIKNYIQSLSEKLQKNASRLDDNEEFIVDFTAVLSIDAGAAFGIVDGLQFVLEGNSTLRVLIVGIKVS